MVNKLRVLIVEDIPSDAELAERELRAVLKNYAVQVVDTEDEFVKALKTFKPDLIISDYKMPTFDGLSALKIKQKKFPNIPFIILTGSMNEDTAVDCMKAGADDYVIKEHIKRLGSSVLGALEKKKNELERKRAEEEIRKLSTAVQQSPSVIAITDLKGNLEYVNPKFTKLTGYKSKEAIGQNPRILKSGYLSDSVYKKLWQTITSGKEWRGEFHNKKKNGEFFWEAASISPIYNKQGKIINYIKVAEDITERKKAEEALKASEEKFRNFVETSTDLVFRLSKTGNIDYVSPRIKDLYDYQPDELIGKHLRATTPAGDIRRALNALNMISSGKPLKNFEINQKAKSGRIIPMEINAVPVYESGKIVGLQGIMRDITERKQAEEKIQQQNVFLNKVLESLTHPFYVIDTHDYTISLANSASGFKSSLMNTTCHSITHKSEKPCQSKEHPCPLEIVKKTKKPTMVEHIHFDKVGNARNVEVYGYPLFDKKGNVIHMIEYCLDVTERKQAEEALQKSENNLRALFNAMIDIVFEVDYDGRIINVAPTSPEFVFKPTEDIIDKTLHEIFPKPQADKFLEFIRKCLDENKTGIIEYPLVIDNKTMWFEGRGTPKAQNSVLYIARDVTERKKAEEQIARDLKIKTALLQEVYHRTKNNMQVIISMLKVQSRNLEDRTLTENKGIDFLHDSFSDMINKIKAMSLVHGKLYQAKDLSHINLKEYIEDLVRYLMRGYSTRTENVILKLELDDVFVLIDSAIPLGLVLNEIISNVFKHAFPHTKNDELFIKLYKEEDETINIHLSDNGVGIPNDFDLKNVNTMGMQTVFSLTEHQLMGEVKYDTKKGLKWHISFKDNRYKERV